MWEIIRGTNVIGIWQDASITVNLAGLLKTGLLVKYRDIDIHIYSKGVTISDSFAVMPKIAGHPRIRQVLYINLLDTDEYRKIIQ